MHPGKPHGRSGTVCLEDHILNATTAGQCETIEASKTCIHGLSGLLRRHYVSPQSENTKQGACPQGWLQHVRGMQKLDHGRPTKMHRPGIEPGAGRIIEM
jgi:hypothetical protein